MKKKFYRYAMVGILFFMTILGIKTVKAETYTGQAIWPSEFISNIYVKKIKPDGYGKYQQMQFIRRSEDNKFVYCLQPYTDIDNNLPYYEVIREDYEKVLNMTEEQWDRISLLAYYGYQYNENGYDHSSNKWYAITQVMIWRTTNPESDIYFTDSLNGNRISSFNDEIAEMENLIQNHYKVPSFESNLTLPLGSSITLTDKNNVLNNYKISSAENVTATISGNTITITATSIGNAKVNLIKKTTKYETNPIVYFSNHSQNVMRVGNYDPVNTNIKLEIFGGKVEINKLDRDTQTNTPQGQGTLQGAVYGVYNTSGDLITKLTTDKNGYAISDYLPSVGEFVIKEISPSNGYTLDKNIYRVIVDKDNLLASVNVLEKVITGKVEITKVYASAKTQIMLPEAGVKFAIYDINNNLIQEVITDKNGKINITLPYGEYILKQLTTTEGYEYADDYNFKISEDGQEIKEVISNAEITAKLKVVKIDADTKEVIKRANIKFKIFDVKNNEYVCQKITYPTAKTICEYETDENGILITPYPLFSGTYKLEEVDQVIDGYLWNKESVEFKINENTDLIKNNELGIIYQIVFANKPVKGEVVIEKLGEFATLNDKEGYSFISKNLSGVEFGLYQDDNLILKGTTDEKGNLKFENLNLGSYCIKEIKTLDGYILNDKPYCFELKYKDQYTAVITYKLLIENKLKTSKYEFTKKDYSTDAPLPNTTMEIYTINNELVYSGITDSNGKIIIERLPIGKYYILEKEAPEGYLINEEKMFFEVTFDDEIVKSEMKDQKITGTLEFTKTDFIESKTLPNTTIEIYTINDELIYTGTTDENGMIIIDKIEYGKYYILEKEAPEGYQLNTEKMYFEIKEDGEIVKCKMKDEIIIEVPNTEKNEVPYLEIISLLLALAGIGVILYAKNKKNK